MRKASSVTLAALGVLAGLAPRPVLAQARVIEPDSFESGEASAPIAAIEPDSLDPAHQPVTPGVARLLGKPLFPQASLDSARALDCMTAAIAYEAGNQPVEGQQAVGQVILNRLRDPRFPKSVCGVVFSGSERQTGCQFTFTCDGSLNRRLTDATLTRARSVAATVLVGAAPDRVAGATHYHADYVLPYWASTGTPVARIGAHIFYRMPGDSRLAGLGGVGVSGMAMPETLPPALSHLSARRRRGGKAAQPVALAARPVFAPWGLAVNAQPEPQ